MSCSVCGGKGHNALTCGPEFIPCELRCEACRARHTLTLAANKPIRDELAKTTCPTCGRLSRMRLAPKAAPPSERRPPEPEPPDMEGDEFLLARRAGKKWSDIS